MRIVPNLNEIHQCPCCGSNTLAFYIHGDPSISDYKKCINCGEKIYTNERTYSAEEQHTVDCMERIIDTAGNEFKQKEKEAFLFEMREEISNLTWNIHDGHSYALVENIQNILNKIIDYIEEN